MGVEDMCYDIDEKAPTRVRRSIKEWEERCSLLEEFVAAFLWRENFILNFGGPSPMDTYNERVIRLKEAMEALPKDLFEEISREDAIIYADL